MMFDLKTRKPECICEIKKKGSLHFKEDRMYCEIYRKSPYTRGNNLWKQLSSDIQHVKDKSEFHRFLTDAGFLNLKEVNVMWTFHVNNNKM